MRLYIFILYFLVISCSSKTRSNSNVLEKNTQIDNLHQEYNSFNSEETPENFTDDTYTANVEYYNPNTGTTNTYTLEVEVVDNTVTVIYFNNGGWLDDSHIISGGELDENGSTEIETDNGYIYTITVDL